MSAAVSCNAGTALSKAGVLSNWPPKRLTCLAEHTAHTDYALSYSTAINCLTDSWQGQHRQEIDLVTCRHRRLHRPDTIGLKSTGRLVSARPGVIERHTMTVIDKVIMLAHHG